MLLGENLLCDRAAVLLGGGSHISIASWDLVVALELQTTCLRGIMWMVSLLFPFLSKLPGIGLCFGTFSMM